MRRKSMLLVILLFVILLASLCFAEEKSGESIAVLKTIPVPTALASSGQVSGNGNITLESNDVDAICSQIQALIKKYNVVVRNFNINDIPNTNYKNAYMDLSLDIALAPAFMNEVIGLGKIKANSYNENKQQDNIEDLNRQLVDLKDSYDKILKNKPDLEIFKVVVAKITEIENRIKSLQYNYQEAGKARININIQPKGWNRNQPTIQSSPKNWTMIITAVVFLFIGIFLRNLFSKKPQA